jgi:hypothetical protein
MEVLTLVIEKISKRRNSGVGELPFMKGVGLKVARVGNSERPLEIFYYAGLNECGNADE